MPGTGVLVLDVCATALEDQTDQAEGGFEGAEMSPTDAVFAGLERGEGAGAAAQQGTESDPTLFDCLLALPATLLDDLFGRL
jgi:hypothetical protein